MLCISPPPTPTVVPHTDWRFPNSAQAPESVVDFCVTRHHPPTARSLQEASALFLQIQKLANGLVVYILLDASEEGNKGTRCIF